MFQRLLIQHVDSATQRLTGHYRLVRKRRGEERTAGCRTGEGGVQVEPKPEERRARSFFETGEDVVG